MIPDEIKNKIDSLRKEYVLPEDQALLSEIETNLRTKILQSKLKDNDTVKEIIADALRRMEDINFLLANDEAMTESERHYLYRERKVHRFWLNRFGYDAELYQESVTKFLDSKLSPNEAGSPSA